MRLGRHGRSLRLALAALVAGALTLAVPAGASATGGDYGGDHSGGKVTVMTRNLYLGASLTDAIAAQTPVDFVTATTRIWATAQFTNFPVRAGALADEIQSSSPDVIGLQEVSHWLQLDATTGAVVGQIDFLSLLQSELAKRGLSYDVASVSQNANLGPFPVVCDLTTYQLCDYGLVLQDRDVILVKHAKGIKWFNPRSGEYATQQYFQPPVPGAQPISFSRGWASVRVVVRGHCFKFVNTHLETEDFPAVQEAQAKEFLAGPARSHGQVIVTGDFNSAADGSTTTTYAMLTKPFTDSWAVKGVGPGLSCCENETLTSYPPDLHSRIDLVLYRHGPRAVAAQEVGVQPFEFTPPLYASDHAGVVATLRLR